MPSENLERVLERLATLTPAERQELQTRLETWPTAAQSTEDDLDRRLLAAGVINRIPAQLADVVPYRRWKPIAIKGKSLSETVIEERR